MPTLSNEERKILQDLCKILRIFVDALNTVTGEKLFLLLKVNVLTNRLGDVCNRLELIHFFNRAKAVLYNQQDISLQQKPKGSWWSKVELDIQRYLEKGI